jgi:hypothetical protein
MVFITAVHRTSGDELKPNAAQQRVDRYQFLRITNVVLGGVNRQPRAPR